MRMKSGTISQSAGFLLRGFNPNLALWEMVPTLIVIFLLALQCSGCGAFFEDYTYNPLGSAQTSGDY